jgi:hypothetical protein
MAFSSGPVKKKARRATTAKGNNIHAHQPHETIYPYRFSYSIGKGRVGDNLLYHSRAPSSFLQQVRKIPARQSSGKLGIQG